MVAPYILGFKPCMGMETNVLQRNLTMEKWVFGFDIGYQLVPLIHISFCGSPSLGLGSRWICHFSWLFGVWSWLCIGKMEATSIVSKVRVIDFIEVFDNILCGFNNSCSSSFIIRGCRFPSWHRMS